MAWPPQAHAEHAVSAGKNSASDDDRSDASAFAAYAETMQPLHRQVVVENRDPASLSAEALMADLGKEFASAENMREWLRSANQGFVYSMPGVLPAPACAALRDAVDSSRRAIPDSVDQLPDHQLSLEGDARSQLEELIGDRRGSNRLFGLPLEFYRAEKKRNAARRQQQQQQLEAHEEQTDDGSTAAAAANAGGDDLWPPVYSLEEAFVRRYSTDTRPYNPFHQDRYHLTINVALSSDSDHTGGSLIVVTDDRVKRIERTEGEALVHTSDLVHAVSAMTSGVRYSLILVSSAREPPMNPAPTPLATLRSPFPSNAAHKAS